MSIANDLIDFTFAGDPYDPIKRVVTGLYSFDRAFEPATGEIGMPVGTGYEVFGIKSTGKSTYCYSMIAILGNLLKANISLADLEGFDPGHFTNILQFNKYKGIVNLIHQGGDEEILEKLEDSLDPPPLKKGEEPGHLYNIGMLDSIAAISPIAEKEGDLGGANMGRRAFLMAQFSRRLLPTVFPRKSGSENVYFFTNHWYPKMGINQRGYQSPGGEIKGFLCGVQIHLSRKYINIAGKQERSYPDGSYILTGDVYKNRYGKDRRTFLVFMKAGVGIHKGITAILDGVAEKKVTKRGVVKIGDKSFGHFKKIIQDEWQNDEFFDPFYEALGVGE